MAASAVTALLSFTKTLRHTAKVQPALENTAKKNF
jgi:hypothetical protein